jgi:hypothetical protein
VGVGVVMMMILMDVLESFESCVETKLKELTSARRQVPGLHLAQSHVFRSFGLVLYLVGLFGSTPTVGAQRRDTARR